MNFVELWMKGIIHETEIEDFIRDWHEGDGSEGMGLHTYLGLTWEQYKEVATTPSNLKHVLEEIKHT